MPSRYASDQSPESKTHVIFTYQDQMYETKRNKHMSSSAFSSCELKEACFLTRCRNIGVKNKLK